MYTLSCSPFSSVQVDLLWQFFQTVVTVNICTSIYRTLRILTPVKLKVNYDITEWPNAFKMLMHQLIESRKPHLPPNKVLTISPPQKPCQSWLSEYMLHANKFRLFKRESENVQVGSDHCRCYYTTSLLKRFLGHLRCLLCFFFWPELALLVNDFNVQSTSHTFLEKV